MVKKIVPLSENQLAFRKVTLHDFYPTIRAGILVPKHSKSSSSGNEVFVYSHLLDFKLGSMLHKYGYARGNQVPQRRNIKIINRASESFENILNSIFGWTFNF